uniref:PH domain-containing protein n=1 Tax=Macrostomum lignano TaxID=282301 RepID=A0A1I8GN16_9PLAT
MNGMFQNDMRLWPKVVVINWVKNLDPSFAEYMHVFIEHGITGDQLLNMTHDDLVQLGIDKVGPQAILLEAVDSVKRLNSSYMEADTLQLHIYQLSVAANCLVQSIQAYITLINQIDSNPMERALYEHDKGRYQLDFFTALVELVEAAKEAVSWLCRVPFYSSLDTETVRLLHSIQQSIGNIVSAFPNYSDSHQGKALQDIKEQSLKLNTTCEKYVTGFKDPLAVVPCQLELVHIKRNPGDNKWVTNESAVYGNLIQKGDEVLAVADQPVVCLPHQCVSSIIEQTPGVLQLVLRKRPCYSESRQGRPGGRKQRPPKFKRGSKKRTQAEAAAVAAAVSAAVTSRLILGPAGVDRQFSGSSGHPMATHMEHDESVLTVSVSSRQPPQITLTESAEPRRPKYPSVSSLPDHQQQQLQLQHQQQQQQQHPSPAMTSPSRNRNHSHNGGGGTPNRSQNRTPSREDPRGSCVSDESGVCRGWLLMKKPRSTIMPAKWTRHYCVLKNNAFYYYKTDNIQEEHAEGLINMPHLTVTFAESERGQKYPFHIENRAVQTTFTFAADIESDRTKWVNCLALATIGYKVADNQRIAGFDPPFVAIAPSSTSAAGHSITASPSLSTHSTLTMSSTVETVDDAEFSMMSAASLVSGSTASLPPPVPPRLSKSGAASSARNSPLVPRRDPPPPPPPPRHLPVLATSTASSSQSESPTGVQARSSAGSVAYRPMTQILEGAIVGGVGNKRESELLRKVMRAKRLEREIQDKKQQLELVSQFLSSPEAASPDSVSEFLNQHASQLGINRFIKLGDSSGASLSSDSSTVI